MESVRQTGVVIEYTGPLLNVKKKKELMNNGEGNYLMELPKSASSDNKSYWIDGKYGSEARMVNQVCSSQARNLRALHWKYRNEEGKVTHSRVFLHATKNIDIMDNKPIPGYMSYQPIPRTGYKRTRSDEGLMDE